MSREQSMLEDATTIREDGQRPAYSGAVFAGRPADDRDPASIHAAAHVTTDDGERHSFHSRRNVWRELRDTPTAGRLAVPERRVDAKRRNMEFARPRSFIPEPSIAREALLRAAPRPHTIQSPGDSLRVSDEIRAAHDLEGSEHGQRSGPGRVPRSLIAALQYARAEEERPACSVIPAGPPAAEGKRRHRRVRHGAHPVRRRPAVPRKRASDGAEHHVRR